MTKKALRSDQPLLDLPHHGRPVTRRDFLGRGLLTGAAAVTAPNLLNMLVNRAALAAPGVTCGIGGGGGNIPYIGIDLAGGANTAGSNVLVGTQGQLDFLSARGYERQGLPEDMIPNGDGTLPTDFVAADLGLRFHSDSAFYLGIQSKLSPGVADLVNGCVIAARSNNDTDQNPHNPIYGISRAGAGGALVELIGTESSVSGGRSMAPVAMIDPSLRPTKVDQPRDARGLVDTGKLVDLLGTEDAGLVMLASELISEMKLGRMTEADATKELIRCGYVETTQLVSTFGDPNQLDPELDPLITGGATPIFTAADFNNSSFRKTASVMKLVNNRYAGAGTIELGGYDYHDGTRATGEVRDFVAGQCMGAVIEYAARLSTPIMVYVFSDGSVVSNGRMDNSTEGKGKGVWQSDNSGTSAVFMLAYNPLGRPAMTPAAPENQIGRFSLDGNVDTGATKIADAVTALSEAIVLNYMALNGDVGQFETLFPDQTLGTGLELDEFIAFAPLV